MKNYFIIALFITSVISGQIAEKIDSHIYIGSFNKFKKISSTNISFNEIKAIVFPLDGESLEEFVIKFVLPFNIMLYPKRLRNGQTTYAGYSPIESLINKDKREIIFSYKGNIDEINTRVFWFHVVPFLTDTGKIVAKCSWKGKNGKEGNAIINSGPIVSQNPPIEKIVVDETDALRFYLKYNYDFEYYIHSEDNPYYNLILTGPENRELKLNTNKLNIIHDNQQRLYTIKEGKITIKDTEWDVSGMSFTVKGKIVESPVPVFASSGTNIKHVDLIGFDNMEFYVTGKIIPYEFSKYPSLLNVGLNLIKIRFQGGFHFIPISINFYSRFKDESFWVMTIKSEYQINNFLSFSFGGGLGYETSWTKQDIMNNIITYELGGAINLDTIWDTQLMRGMSLKINMLAGHLSDAHEANISGIYLGLSKIIPTRLIK